MLNYLDCMHYYLGIGYLTKSGDNNKTIVYGFKIYNFINGTVFDVSLKEASELDIHGFSRDFLEFCYRKEYAYLNDFGYTVYSGSKSFTIGCLAEFRDGRLFDLYIRDGKRSCRIAIRCDLQNTIYFDLDLRTFKRSIYGGRLNSETGLESRYYFEMSDSYIDYDIVEMVATDFRLDIIKKDGLVLVNNVCLSVDSITTDRKLIIPDGITGVYPDINNLYVKFGFNEVVFPKEINKISLYCNDNLFEYTIKFSKDCEYLFDFCKDILFKHNNFFKDYCTRLESLMSISKESALKRASLEFNTAKQALKESSTRDIELAYNILKRIGIKIELY